MSCYEWERGTITIPTKEWAGFRKGLLEAWNRKQLGLLERAQGLYARLKEAIKGKRGGKRDEALKAALERLLGTQYARDEATETVRAMLVKWDHAKRVHTLGGRPQKKDLKLFAVSKDATITMGDADVTLRNKGRTVTWDVGENNHAREHAREHWFAKELFRRLDGITWTRGSGGTIVGNDEYARDAGRDHEGGGGNYVTAEYSLAKQKRDRTHGAARHRFGARCPQARW